MGTFDVELSPETVEASLLTAQGGGRRSRRLLLERLVHPLVAAILLGVAGFDELGGDAQADPPNGEAAQSADGRRRKGHTVVGTNDGREAVFLEQAAYHGLRSLVAC